MLSGEDRDRRGNITEPPNLATYFRVKDFLMNMKLDTNDQGDEKNVNNKKETWSE